MRFNDMVMSDDEVRAEVFRELRAESRLTGKGMGVAVKGGEVTLTGAVASEADVLAAVEAARRANGSLDVRSELKVVEPAPRRPLDADIAGAVRAALEWDAVIPATRISVAVSNGWVALYGSVDLLREQQEAERVARHTRGVRGVYNLIEVRPPSARAENVRAAIESALKRRAAREADRLGVKLDAGTVSLSGKVHTWAEKQTILGALRQAPGVERINDQLSVDPYF